MFDEIYSPAPELGESGSYCLPFGRCMSFPKQKEVITLQNINASSVLSFTDAPLDITYLESCPSTNTLMKEYAAKNAPEGSLLITEHQSAGRGRLGKTFFSPKGCGLYFSLLLRPSISAENAVFITVAAAVSVRRAVQKLLGIDTEIKWVNDVYYQNKKFCGILTESALTSSGQLAYAILGIGINILPPEGGYPEEFAYKTTNLKDVAGTLPDDFKNKLIGLMMQDFFACYQNLEHKDYLSEYRTASCVIGKNIEILTGPHAGPAKAIDIDDNANLVVELPDGRRVSLSSGDVSIHL